ncbi:hypothetical protein ACFLT1_00040 [Bacteroidota bacterium]
MAKIIVHIGLPKTATSSLQVECFTNLNDCRIKYLGLKDPRESKQSKLYLHFYNSVTKGTNIDETSDLFKNELEKGYDLLISDEMIVVGDWQMKIRNLFNIINELDYKLLVTVREPASAMFSYYTELYHIFEKEKRSFTELALQHNYMKIYHYKIFFQFLLQYFDKTRIKVFKFENIINNELGELKDLVHIVSESALQNHNAKRLESDYVIKEQEIRAINLIAKMLSKLRLKINYELFFVKPLRKMAFFLFNRSVAKKSYKIHKPDREELDFIRKALQDEISFIKHNFGIFY